MINYVHFGDFYKDSIPKQIIITYPGGSINNTDLYQRDGFELTESICSADRLKWGSCEAAKLHLKISSANVVGSLVDKVLTVKMIINNDTANPLTIGQYKVYTDTPDKYGYYRDVVAYDALYDVLNTDYADWYMNEPFPMTMKQFRDDFFAECGLTQETVTLPNDTLTVDITLLAKVLTGKDILFAICEANGRFGHLDRSGTFRYIFLPEVSEGVYPANNLYPSNTLYPAEENGTGIDGARVIDGNYAASYTNHISKLIIRDDDNSIGGSAGTGTNVYVMQGNFLLMDQTSAAMAVITQRIFSQIREAMYQPAELTVVGNPCFEVGDIYNANCRGKIVRSYILSRKLKGVQALRDTYTAKGTENAQGKANTLSSQITTIQSRQHELIVDSQMFKSAIYDGQGNSKIEQNAQAITLEVTRATNAEGALDGRIDVQAGQISLKVSKADIVSDLNNKMSSSITITPTNIDISSDGALTINTTQFILDSHGNATFKGNLVAATGSFTGSITATGGSIGGFGIGASSLKVNNHDAFYYSNQVIALGNSSDVDELNLYSGNSITLDADGLEFKMIGGNAYFIGQSSVELGVDILSAGEIRAQTGSNPSTYTTKTISWQKLDDVQSTDYVLVGDFT